MKKKERSLMTTPITGVGQIAINTQDIPWPESPEFDHPSSIIHFRVDDIEAARAELVDRGVAFDDEPHLIALMPDHELWMTFFRDPDRNLHGLMSEVR
jgi:hypothetical protein